LNNEIRKDEISLADDYTEADEPLWWPSHQLYIDVTM
jgi:hypothetical protein